MLNKKDAAASFETDIPLLRELEDLGALSEQFGIFKIKPFRDWLGSSWKNAIFGIRLCNAGQILEIASYCNTFSETARTQATKLELLIESVISVNDVPLLTPEALEKYNQTHRTNLTSREYLRNWVKNLEQLVVDRLDSVYGGLQLKQERLLRGEYLCDGCGKVLSEFPEKGVRILYSLGEILCSDCNVPEITKNFDLVAEVSSLQKNVESKSSGEQVSKDFSSFGSGGQICPDCHLEFDTVEDLANHRPNCPKNSV